MKQERCITSLVTSHIQRNMNRKNNDEQLWLMRRSNYDKIRILGGTLIRQLESDPEIESIRSSITNHATLIDAKKSTWALLIANIIGSMEPKRVLEIGTSVGISSAYISKYSPEAIVDTIEIEEDLVKKAKDNHIKLGLDNIDVYQGDYRSVMQQLMLQYWSQYEVIFKDAYHVGSANVALLEDLRRIGWCGLVILDDIRWSWDMLKAWNEIKLMPHVSVAIDCYHIGVLYLSNENRGKEFYKYSLSGLVPK